MNAFIEIKQKPPINKLITFNKDKYKIEPDATGLGDKDFAIVFDQARDYKITASTLQLLLYILVKASALTLTKDDRQISISLNQYLKLRNNDNPVSARRKINEDLNKLLSLHIRFEDKNYKDEKSKIHFFDMNLFSSITKFRNSEIQVALTPEFVNYYNTLPKMYLPTKIFEIDTRYNPNAFYILWELAYQHNVNRNNKERANTISVKTLLNYCPKIPDYNEIKESGQIYQRIIQPFERDMQALLSIIDWYYIGIFDTKQPLGKKRLSEFLELKLHFIFKNMPKNSRLAIGKDDTMIPSDDIVENEINTI